MSICSRCPHNLTDSEGNLLPEHEGKAYENMPCATCDLIHGPDITLDNDNSNAWQSKLSIDSMTGDNGIDFDEKACTGWNEEREEWANDIPEEAIKDRLTDFFRFFLRMDSQSITAVSAWMIGKPLQYSADKLNITQQGVHRILKEAHKQFPKLEKIKSIARNE